MSTIELNRVTRRFGDKVAVDDLSLTVEAGELFSLIGPNGAGKTTTIKMIAGLLRPSAGKVAVCGADTVRDPIEARRPIGYVPDQPYIYEKLSGREFLRFVGRLHTMPDAALDAAIDFSADFFDMRDYIDDLAEGYSHGMRQRVVFSAALLHDPKVLLIDEPMVGLDPVAARQVKDLLRRRAAAGVAIFLSTHTLSLVEDVADTVAIISGGRIRAHGPLREVMRHARGDERLEEVFLKMVAEGGDQNPHRDGLEAR